MTIFSNRATILALGSAVGLLWLGSVVGPRGRAGDGRDAAAAPNLILEWCAGQACQHIAEPLTGRAGEEVRPPFAVRNCGGRDAFAVIIEGFTALGGIGSAIRVQPGPAAGDAVRRRIVVGLACGMEELCLEGRLQTLEPGDPRDPDTGDNTICRLVEVKGCA